MSVNKTTKSPTESDFEAEIHSAIQNVFPWLPASSIHHQTTFSFFFGRKRITIDGTRGDNAKSRADIILYYQDCPLAVLELKRKGIPIEPDDDAQGISYARVLNPMAPLVVVTNGQDVRLLETHTAKEWAPKEPSEKTLADLIRSASSAASHNLKTAVNTLMGSNPDVWAQAIRHTSEATIAELSGGWSDSLQPFVSDFLIPRKATQVVLEKLQAGEKLILIDGPPIIGKSNVLRELSQITFSSADFVTLFIEGDSGASVFQQLAHTLTLALNWPVTRDEVRTWLLNLSNTNGPSLVLAIDGIGQVPDDIRRDIVDLTSLDFGQSVRLVISLDDTEADRIVLNSTGRKASAIGRRASRIQLTSLDNQEFGSVRHLLSGLRINIMHGGEVSPEFRVPWILRTVISHVTCEPQYANETLAAVIPPFLGLNLVEHTRQIFDDTNLRRLFQGIASAVIEDSRNQDRPISLILESISAFVVQRSTLRKFLESAEIDWLTERGYIRSILHDSGKPILVIRLPELLVSEAASLLANELIKRNNEDALESSNWLSNTSSRIPLGDIITTQAIMDAAKREGSIPLNLIIALIQSPPKREKILPGTKAAIHVPDIGLMNITFKKNGFIELNAHGHHHDINPDPGDYENAAYVSFDSWLILSHLAGCPFEIEAGDSNGPSRIDPAILLEVGTCPIVLRRPGYHQVVESVLIHELPNHVSIVCHKAGIIEPITLSILKFISFEGMRSEEWIENAINRKSQPLLARIHIALLELSRVADTEKSGFARRMLKDVVQPAFSSFPALH